MNITLSADSETIDKARKWTLAHGTSLNAIIREQLERLAGMGDREELARQLRENARNLAGNSGGYTFNRQDVYTGKRFGDR